MTISDQARTGREAWNRASNADTGAASGIDQGAEESRDHSVPRGKRANAEAIDRPDATRVPSSAEPALRARINDGDDQAIQSLEEKVYKASTAERNERGGKATRKGVASCSGV